MMEQGPPARYGESVERLMVGRVRDGGPVMVGVERLVAKLKQLDGRLQQLAHELRGAIRIYYNVRQDTYQLRQVMGKGWSVYHGKTVDAEVMGWLTLAERARVGEAVAVLGERGRIKRSLQVIATIGDTMQRWPGGAWQIRGERGKGKPARWVTLGTERGVLERRYMNGNEGKDQEISEADEMDWSE